MQRFEANMTKEPIITVFIKGKYCIYNFFIQTRMKTLLGLRIGPKVREVCNTFEFAYKADK